MLDIVPKAWKIVFIQSTLKKQLYPLYTTGCPPKTNKQTNKQTKTKQLDPNSAPIFRSLANVMLVIFTFLESVVN